MKTTFLHEWITDFIALIEFWTDIFQDNIGDCVSVISSPVASFASGAGGTTIETVRASLEGVCYTMLAVFAMIEIVDAFTKKGEDMRWEEVARLLIKVIICKNLITIAPVILTIVQGTVTTALENSELGASLDNLSSTLSTGLTAKLRNYTTEIIYDKKGYNVFLKNFGLILRIIMSGVGGILLSVIMSGLSLVIRATSYLRGFELVVMASVAGIPLSFLAYSETKDVPKRFLLNYLAVCLQGLLLMICVFLYANIINGITGQFEMLFWTFVLFMSVNKTGDWALKVTGQ